MANRLEGLWPEAGMAIESETTLSAQDRGQELQYRAAVVNKPAECPAGNTVMAVM